MLEFSNSQSRQIQTNKMCKGPKKNCPKITKATQRSTVQEVNTIDLSVRPILQLV